MKHMNMKGKFFAVLLVCVLAAVSCASMAEAKPLEITILNIGSEILHYAFAEVNGDDDSISVVKGWYLVGNTPFDKPRVFDKVFEFNPNNEYYWYCREGKEGDDDFEGWVRPDKKSFTSKNGKKLANGKKVGFHRFKVNEKGVARKNFDR